MLFYVPYKRHYTPLPEIRLFQPLRVRLREKQTLENIFSSHDLNALKCMFNM